ncbi:MAG: response regulator [Oscillospiraceae bacterium]|nr:response regulator [Oscillospiraceae bacterium]
MKRKKSLRKTAQAHSIKRVLCLLLCFMILLSCLMTANAAQTVNNKTVKAGVFYFDGYHMKDEDGRLTGYGIEFLNFVSQYSHLNFSFVGYDRSWNDMLEMLDSGEIDVVTSARKTPEREEKYAFSLPIGRNSTVLSIRADNTRLLSGDYATYRGITVGVLTGSSQNQSLSDFARDKEFTYQTREYSDTEQMAKDLQNGTIDAILSSNLRRTENEKTLDTIETDYFYAIVRKDDKTLLDEINYAIDQMNVNEGDWSNVMYYKYYGNSSPAELSFTPRELAYIQDVVEGRKQITVTSMGDRKPYSFVKNGELKGILPDYFAELMKLAGLPYETVVPNDRSEYYDLANNDGVDVVIDWRQDQLNSKEVGQKGFYTSAYLHTGVALVTRKDFSGKIKTLAVADLLGDIAIEKDMIGDAEILNCQTKESALQAVLDGKADATYVYTYTAQSFVNNDHTSSLQYSVINSLHFDFKMYVRNSCDHELITILNKCIEHIHNDTMSQLITAYTANSPSNVSFSQYLQAHPEIVVMVSLLAVVIFVVIIALELRSRWSKRLLHTTERANQMLEDQLTIVNALSRDFINVYAVNPETTAIRAIKIAGYVAAGLSQDSQKEAVYNDLLTDYVNNRVLPEDRQYISEAMALETVIEKLKTCTEYSGSYRVLIDGEVHTYQFICATHEPSNEPPHEQSGIFLVGFRNIDEIVRREHEQKAVLETALAEAQRANVAKTTFLNNMSHDIRTPMNAIIGFTSLAVSHIENQTQVEGYLSKILTASKHLLSLINDILDMSRIESGKVKIEENEASLPEIMHDLKTIVQADVKSKQLSFHVDTLDVTNETIICDKLRLNQVLLNILSNAMKYTGPGGTVSVRIIQTDDAPDGYASYQFRIKDTGIGMSQEFLKHIFEPFEREQTATVSGIQGTGLGLAITKNIVDMMNGTIDVTSEEGKGSEFVVSFCFRVKDDTDSDEYIEKLADMHALVVDDDTHTCTSVSKMLSSLGMRSDWTTRGEEAVIRTEFAMEQDDPFRVFLIDWLLPDLNGVETARRLRRIVGEDATIIILTAYDWSDIEAEAKEAGVNAFCSKPLFLSELKCILTAPYKEIETAEEDDASAQFLIGKKILLVDDNELNLEIARTVLEEAGLVIDTASDGTEVVEKIQTVQPGTYDLILMDIQMPVMDGYTAARTIRAMDDPAKANIPIVAMTANAFEEDRQKALEAGMDGHVPKPIDIPKLFETLSIILSEEK